MELPYTFYIQTINFFIQQLKTRIFALLFSVLTPPITQHTIFFFEWFINITLPFLLLITLVHTTDHTNVAVGTRTVVHRIPIEKEVAINVTLKAGFDQLIHPQYNYSVEAGGFTAWKMVDCHSLTLYPLELLWSSFYTVQTCSLEL